MKFLITGGTGYIGRRLAYEAYTQGHEVIIAARRPPKPVAGIELPWVFFDLTAPSRISLPNDVSAVFHLAAFTTADHSDPANEIEASQQLIYACERQKSKFIYVSSQTARSDAPTAYGRTKKKIENITTTANGYVVRPGLIYGGYESGLFKTLSGLVRTLPLYPSFRPPPQIQPLHVDDLVTALLNCATRKNLPPRVFCVGAVQPISFNVFMHAISTQWVRKRRLAILVPISIVHLSLIALGSRIRNKFGLERLQSLFNLPPMQTAVDNVELGIVPRPLYSGMNRCGNFRRRHLIQEGLALLSFASTNKPKTNYVKRYVRKIEETKNPMALGMPWYFLQWPSLLNVMTDDRVLSLHSGRKFINRLQLTKCWALEGASTDTSLDNYPLQSSKKIWWRFKISFYWMLFNPRFSQDSSTEQ